VELGPFATNRRGIRGGVEIRALPTADLGVERACEQLYVRLTSAIVTHRVEQYITEHESWMWDVEYRICIGKRMRMRNMSPTFLSPSVIGFAVTGSSGTSLTTPS
jgi:hypothetical protein